MPTFRINPSKRFTHSPAALAASRIASRYKGYRARRGALVKLIKNTQLRQCETKRSAKYVEGVVTKHNTAVYVQNIAYTSQGVQQAGGMNEEDSNRVGDEIIPTGILVKLHYLSSVDRPNVCGQVYLIKYRSEDVLDDSIVWRGPAGAGAQMIRLVDSVNTNNVTVLKKLTIQNRANYAIGTAAGAGDARLNGTQREFYVKLPKRKMKYDDKDTKPKWKDYALMWVFCDANNTLTSDTVGYMSYTTTFFFKDP